MRKQLYLAVIERLKTITDALNQPIIEHFDLWNNNVEFIEQETAFNCPAVFIEPAPINWKNLSMQAQEADVIIRLHIVTRWENISADGSASQEQALELFDLLDSIIKALTGLQMKITNCLTVQKYHYHNTTGIISTQKASINGLLLSCRYVVLIKALSSFAILAFPPKYCISLSK